MSCNLPTDKPTSGNGRFLEAVIVCDGYGDFLEETIPYTLRSVNRLVVVTSKDDNRTKRICSKLDVNCVEGWNHKREDFDKAKAINHGLAHLRCSDYILHQDADMILPDAFREWFLTSKCVNPKNIYGVDRFDCRNRAELRKVMDKGWAHSRLDWRFMIQPPHGLPFCTRVGHGDYEGWVPIGFFQLWHGSQRTRYPVKPGASAERTDLLFAANWPPENRILIPDFYAIHLMTDPKMGANWKGRKSPKWG